MEFPRHGKQSPLMPETGATLSYASFASERGLCFAHLLFYDAQRRQHRIRKASEGCRAKVWTMSELARSKPAR